jgi:hypothetical protein
MAHKVTLMGEELTHDLEATRDDQTPMGPSRFANAVIEEMNQ